MKWREAVKRKQKRDSKVAVEPVVEVTPIETSSSGRVYIPMEAPTLLSDYRKKATILDSKKAQVKTAEAAVKVVKEKIIAKIPEGNNIHFGNGKVYHKAGGDTKTVNHDILMDLVIFAKMKGGDVEYSDIVTIKPKKSSWVFGPKI